MCDQEFNQGHLCDQEFNHGHLCDQEFNHGHLCDQEFNQGHMCDQEFNQGHLCDQEFNHGLLCDQEFNHGHLCDQELNHGHLCDQEFNHGHLCDQEFKHDYLCDQEFNQGHLCDQEFNHGHLCDQEFNHGHLCDQEFKHDYLCDQEFNQGHLCDQEFNQVHLGCTDVLCCMIFVLFVIGYILLGFLAWTHGDPRRVAYPTDSQGHFCGQKGTPNENKTILLYFNLFRCANPSMILRLQCPTTQICVSKCPERFLTYLEMQFLTREDKNHWEYYRQFCKTTARPAKSLSELLSRGDCPPAVYPSRPFLQRCLPDFSKINGTLVTESSVHLKDGSGKTRNIMEFREATRGITKILDARNIGLKVFEDYATTWKWILIGLTVAMALSWIFLILLRFTAGFLFCVFMFGVLGIIGYGIFYCYLQYIDLQQKPQSSILIYEPGLKATISMFFLLKYTWLSMMIILFIIEAIIIIVLIFLRRLMRVAITLLKEGSKAIGYIPSTLVYPVLTFVLLSLCISYWAVTAFFLATSGLPIFKVMVPQGKCIHEDETCDPEIFPKSHIPKVCPGASCNFYSYGGKSVCHSYHLIFQIYNLFALLWLVNFVIALGQCTLAGAFASYYWAMRKPEDIPKCPLFIAFGRAVRYHTGSLALGSLILASVQVFKVIIEYMSYRLKSKFAELIKHLCDNRGRGGEPGNLVTGVDQGGKGRISTNHFLQIALYGKNFCESTKESFSLLMRNILKVAVTDEITCFILLLGKILVSGIVGLLAFLLFTERLQKIVEGPTTLNYYWVPFLTLVLGSYLIAHGFFSVYSMCVKTIIICFLEDLERNDGSPSRPYFVTPDLKEILMESRMNEDKY
ncbi:choline transporter-like protein 5 isoform X1 [Cricetulus griseus]|uniref:choline transporter-like protein 5 isoform X1 n=1 Tax=Cricetulus griseus TaxID=10029 RepID=UPI0004544911|nr:choline transporter-like protein 5 isoform X1 [Cricetulus griseus]